MKGLICGIFLAITCQVQALTVQAQAKWQEDIRYLQQQVKETHVNPFHATSEQEFDAAIEQLSAQLPDLDEPQVEVVLMKIMASLKDGHSNYYPMSGPHQHFPFKLMWIDNTLRVVGTTAQYSDLVGSELVAINGVLRTQIEQQLAPYLYGVDNTYSAQVRFAFQIILAKLLYGVGIIDNLSQAEFTFRTKQTLQTHTIAAVDMRKFGAINVSSNLPEATKLNDIGLPGIRLGFIAASKTAYFDFDSYPKFNEVMTQCKLVVKQLNAHASQHVIIDLRDNEGGSFYTGLAFAACLSEVATLDWQRGVVTLINAGTFSAAMSNAAQYKQLLNAKLIGTPTGGDPNQYGELHVFTLPNSKRQVSVSERYYAFVATPTDALYPDIVVTPTWLDYLEQRDVVFDAALAYFSQASAQ
ncbi:S41 family peptidase [Pseudoalteromonas fenneropenaei]|uniref:S41 family peptidase n=1 Tax=Pseudoalteromonas fenneropenaei TaxID=1737459 RepID=A0ABV7CJV7_9GAMM